MSLQGTRSPYIDMYRLFKTLAFQIDPEYAHHYTVKILSLFPSVFSIYGALDYDEKYQVQTKMGSLPFPLGIAAGLDKNGEMIDYFGQLGLGALEVGTVTPKAQEGNKKPRLFRLHKEKSLRNQMGFNGQGAEKVLSNIKTSNSYKTKLGINFGKNKFTSNDRALDDYLELFEMFGDIGDYYVINVSSPNTPGLRDLQDDLFITQLSSELQKMKVEKPIYLKISPDIEENAVCALSEVIGNGIYSGIIATNTSYMPEIGNGGVSGKLIKSKSRNIRNLTLSRLSKFKDKEVIGVGGVDSVEDLWDFWLHGGKFMQVYTSLIYQGPKMFSKIALKLDSLMGYYGVCSIEELIRLVHIEKPVMPEA